MIRAIAIDDEPMALEVIKAHAKKVSFLDLKETFVSALEALDYIKTQQVDLIFLDINMPDISGLDFSQLLPTQTQVIFTTAYSQYAADAFNLNAVDYLVKPFDFARFMKACQKAFDLRPADEVPQNTAQFLFVKDGYDVVRVNLENLLYVQSEGNYLTFKETDKKTVTRMTLTEAMDLLPKNYLKVHKSFVVNIHQVQKIERHQVTVADKEYVPVSANYHAELLEKLRKI